MRILCRRRNQKCWLRRQLLKLLQCNAGMIIENADRFGLALEMQSAARQGVGKARQGSVVPVCCLRIMTIRKHRNDCRWYCATAITGSSAKRSGAARCRGNYSVWGRARLALIYILLIYCKDIDVLIEARELVAKSVQELADAARDRRCS